MNTTRTCAAALPWIKGIHWFDRSVAVDLSRASIKNAAPCDVTSHGSRNQESCPYRHNGRSGYWAGSSVHEPAI